MQHREPAMDAVFDIGIIGKRNLYTHIDAMIRGMDYRECIFFLYQCNQQVGFALLAPADQLKVFIYIIL